MRGLCVAVPAVTLAAALVAQAAAAPPDTLAVAWADGSPLRMAGKTYVWCGKWDDGADVRTLRIQQGSPFSPPWWMLEVRVALARRGHTVRFPGSPAATGRCSSPTRGGGSRPLPRASARAGR